MCVCCVCVCFSGEIDTLTRSVGTKDYLAPETAIMLNILLGHRHSLSELYYGTQQLRFRGFYANENMGDYRSEFARVKGKQRFVPNMSKSDVYSFGYTLFNCFRLTDTTRPLCALVDNPVFSNAEKAFMFYVVKPMIHLDYLVRANASQALARYMEWFHDTVPALKTGGRQIPKRLRLRSRSRSKSKPRKTSRR
jgi:hypothetical protein